MLRHGRVLFVAFCALCSASLAMAEPAIWHVKGRHNTLYLLGTIHMLRNDEPLPDNIGRAYREAEQLLMEIDLDDMDPIAAQVLTLKLGMQPAGRTLESQLDADTNRKLHTATDDLGLDAGMLSPFQPWLAALTLEQLQLARLGLAADSGIEMQLMQQAARDHKPIHGLETLEQQLSLFANMDDRAQLDYLKLTLTELETAPAELETLLAAWRNGDERQLSQALQQGFMDDPKLFAALTTARNRRWLSVIKPLLDQQQDDYLVAVGALHLIGNEGLVTLLRRAGYTVTRQ